MAKLQEEIVVIKVSRLLRDNQEADIILTDDVINALQGVLQELTGALVEMEKE